MRTMLFAGLLTLLAAATAAAQAGAGASESRWLPWFGCWQQLDETVRDADVPDSLADRDPATTSGVMVCVTPGTTAQAAVFTTIVEGQSSLEETIVADGESQTISQPGCTGAQRTRWSENGLRLFSSAELACADGARSISGLATLAPGGLWVDVQVANAGGYESVRVRRYRRAIDQSRVAAVLSPAQLAQAAAAAHRANAFSLDDVIEASGKVMPSAVEAALAETRASFPLNSRRMLELDAAGVPDRVLDLMVALSFPNKFVIERRQEPAAAFGPLVGAYGPWSWMDASYYYFPYHFAPFGLGGWGYSDYTYFYGAPVYAGGGGITDVQPSGEGRVVNNLGYTRVRSREPRVAGGNFGGGSGGGGSSSGNNGSSGSGGTVSTSGYSGGGGDGGRTAQSRPPHE